MNAITQDETPRRTIKTKRIIPLLLLFLAAVMLRVLWNTDASGPPPPPTKPQAQAAAQTLLATIPSLRADSDTGKAMAVVLQKLHVAPEDVNAWIALGDILAQELRGSGDEAFYTHAESAYRRALQLSPRKADAMTGLAWIYGGRHQFLESVEWAERALAADKNNQTAHGIISDAALEQGDYELAFDHCQKMMDLRPDLSSWSRGAHLLWITGDSSRAIPLMEKAIRSGAPFAENTAWCRSRLAMMLVHKGALLEAAEALAPALRSAPDNTHVLLAAGCIATAQGDAQGAELHYKKVLERGASHDALVALGDLRAAGGDKAAAEDYYSQVEEIHAANVAAGIHDHTRMARFYADHDRKIADALKLAEQHANTRNVREADVLAWVRFKSGDLRGADEAMKQALSQGTPDPEIYFHAGMIAAGVGDHRHAQQLLQKALSLSPHFHPLLATVARETLSKVSSRATAATSPPAAPSAP